MPNKLLTDEAIQTLIDERFKIATTKQTSTDPVVQIAWLAQGIDLWHRSGQKRGHSPEKAMWHIISSVTRLIEEEKTDA